MEQQTESATPIVEQATDYDCFTKAKKNGEPTFTLRAQDVTADLVVDFWVKIQQKVREHMNAGLTKMQAVQAVRSYYFLETYVPASDVKLSGACRIAGEMEKWPARKLAD